MQQKFTLVLPMRCHYIIVFIQRVSSYTAAHGRQSIPSHASKVSLYQRGPSASWGTSGGLCHLRRPGSLIFHQSSAPHTRRVSCSRASRRILRASRASPHPLYASTNPSNQTPPSPPPLSCPSSLPLPPSLRTLHSHLSTLKGQHRTDFQQIASEGQASNKFIPFIDLTGPGYALCVVWIICGL